MKRKSSYWNDEFYVKAYQLARAGATHLEIATHLGVKFCVFQYFWDHKPAFKKAVEEGKRKNCNLSEWIYKRLPGEYKAVWDQVCALEKQKDNIAKVEALFDRHGEGCRKYLFLYALVNNHFNPTTACRKVNIPYEQFKRWVEQDWEFAKVVAQIEEHKDDFFEGKLIELCEQGDSKAIIFANRTRNKGRGYAEKLFVEHTGQVNHTHVIELSEEILSRLSKPARRELLEVIEQAQIEEVAGNGHEKTLSNNSH